LLSFSATLPVCIASQQYPATTKTIGAMLLGGALAVLLETKATLPTRATATPLLLIAPLTGYSKKLMN
jgi:hypothetical protein